MTGKKKEQTEENVENTDNIEVNIEAPVEEKAQKTKEHKKKEPPKFVQTVGKRKRAIARAIVRPGKGVVKINSVPLDLIGGEMVRLKMSEPLILAGDAWKDFDILVNVSGGGVLGQADAVRQCIAKGLVEYLPELKKVYLEYDRNLLVFDSRRTEPHKPGHSSWGPRRAKQRSKR